MFVQVFIGLDEKRAQRGQIEFGQGATLCQSFPLNVVGVNPPSFQRPRYGVDLLLAVYVNSWTL